MNKIKINEYDCALFNDGKEGTLVLIHNDEVGEFDFSDVETGELITEARKFSDIVKITYRCK